MIAHGGDSASYPANSIWAFQHARQVGADALEADLRVTADGRIVCLHDEEVSVRSKTTAVGQAEYRDLHACSAGLATLEDLIGFGLPVYLDVKELVEVSRVEVLRTAVAHANPARFVVGINRVSDGIALRKAVSDIRQVALMHDDHELAEFTALFPGHWVRLHETRTTFERVEHFRRRKAKIMVTCGSLAKPSGHTDRDAFIQLLRLRPDGVVLNDPGLALRTLANAAVPLAK
ncbi:glycerophosphodiester phosphodiesterase family protein [Bradyrhizobium sp. BEA-2-5]|uniref:glycerophosphodiester phosphodiesterase n=1 Tax=Bradyrhizobium sp. BEA-2-5 TaxID=3080015 RepID=UPI00293F78B1|nr:glycerophosphodiester phosphodiesterase family protein [Bradyrhizobium sp. BEA-2-5]WOH80295.1 glycerophosphodiester phosphodiesterase family protein [Bradyrhizobium sp. BEA-2-5]